MKLPKTILRSIGSYLGRNYPKQWMVFRYFLRFHKWIDWKNPKNLNEKILYLSLMTDTTLWTALADKYRVRDYVKKCGFGENLVELYGVWENASLIDFEKLPHGFVLKTNHGSGEIKIIRDKNQINKEEIINYFNKAVATPYGAIESGMHYLRIKPCIIAEQLLSNDNISAIYSTSIIDYKFWCFNGKAKYVYVCNNRDSYGLDVLLYDRDWHPLPQYQLFTKHYRQGKTMPRPNMLQQMLDMAEILSQKFPVVRVDLYCVSGKIYFGEMTFTSLGGLMNYFTDEFLKKAGDLIDLNYKG